MRRGILALGLVCATALPAAAQMTPGTVKLLSKNPALADSKTGDAFVHLEADQSAKFLVIGPEMLQADLRVNLDAGAPQGPPALLTVLAAGKEVARYRITPKAGSETWKGRTDVAPALSIGFYVEVDAGPHAYEFKVSGAPKGAGLLLVPRAKARTALAANAPVVPPRPALAAPSPTPAAVAKATPEPAPVATSTPKGLEDLAVTGPTASQMGRERRSYEALAKAGYALTAQEAFAGAAAFGAEVRWAFGARRSVAVGLEVVSLSFSALVPDDPARADPPSAVDVRIVPVALNAVWWVPVESRVQPYLAAGAALGYGRSVRREIDRESIAESTVGFGGLVFGGVQYDLAGSDLREGSQKLFVEVKGSYLPIPFEAHPFTDWSTLQVLAGASLKF